MEELKAAYPGKFDYKSTKMNLAANQQKEDWFLKVPFVPPFVLLLTYWT
jgi:hypothetical protein